MNNKKVEIGRAILSAVYIAVGIILMTHPGITGIIICRTAGILALIFGAFRAVTALRVRGASWFFQLDLVIGVLLLAFGIFALAQPQVVLSILPVILGVYLLMECVGKLQRAVALKQLGFIRWWTVLVMGILAAVLGGMLIINPFQAAETMLAFLGASLAVDGIADLWVLWCFASQGGKE